MGKAILLGVLVILIWLAISGRLTAALSGFIPQNIAAPLPGETGSK